MDVKHIDVLLLVPLDVGPAADIVTVPAGALGRQIGVLLPVQEDTLTEAIHAAFHLD